MFACYCRVSTDDQSLDRQLEATQDYARSQLGADLASMKCTVTRAPEPIRPDTARGGYREMIADVEAGEIDAVIVNSVSRISVRLKVARRPAMSVHDASFSRTSVGLKVGRLLLVAL